MLNEKNMYRAFFPRIDNNDNRFSQKTGLVLFLLILRRNDTKKQKYEKGEKHEKEKNCYGFTCGVHVS